MSKAEKLAKQAAVFEHLAVYSDRSSFLKSLAQTKPVDDAKIENALKSLDAGLTTWKRAHRNGTTELASVSNFTSQVYQMVDSDLPLTEEKLNEIETASKALAKIPTELNDDSEKKDWFELVTKPASNLVELISLRNQSLSEEIPAVEENSLRPAMNLPTQELTSQKSSTSSISKELQQKLNSLINEDHNNQPIPGKTPISVDGILGPETKAALKEFNDTYYRGHLADNEILKALQDI